MSHLRRWSIHGEPPHVGTKALTFSFYSVWGRSTYPLVVLLRNSASALPRGCSKNHPLMRDDEPQARLIDEIGFIGARRGVLRGFCRFAHRVRALEPCLPAAVASRLAALPL